MSEFSEEDIQKVHDYFEHLDLYRTKKPPPMPEDIFMAGVPMYLGIINKLGNGDPIKAAQRHAMAIVGINEDIANGKLDAKDFPRLFKSE